MGRNIAALEDQLGTKLFARSHEGLSLTAHGSQVSRARRGDGVGVRCAPKPRCRRPGPMPAASVKLSIGATLAAHWLMPRMGTILREHGHLQLEIITHPFPASVRRREADVASCCGRSTAARRT